MKTINVSTDLSRDGSKLMILKMSPKYSLVNNENYESTDLLRIKIINWNYSLVKSWSLRCSVVVVVLRNRKVADLTSALRFGTSAATNLRSKTF